MAMLDSVSVYNTLMSPTASQWLRSVGLVQRSASLWRCSASIAWTGWTHAMTLQCIPVLVATCRMANAVITSTTEGNINSLRQCGCTEIF